MRILIMALVAALVLSGCSLLDAFSPPSAKCQLVITDTIYIQIRLDTTGTGPVHDTLPPKVLHGRCE